MREPRLPPPGRSERLRKLSEWHKEWVRRHMDESNFDPVNPPPYAEAEFVSEARRIMGLCPTCGSRSCSHGERTT